MNLSDHTLNVATLGAVASYFTERYEEARKEAQEEFRVNGIRGAVSITLPSGEVVGEAVVKKPGNPSVSAPEDDVIAWVAEHLPAEIEEYLDSAALTDEELIEYCRKERDDLIKRRVRKVMRDELQKQLVTHDGFLIDVVSGESTKVAKVTPKKADGSFALSPDGNGVRARRLLAALLAGELAGVIELPVTLAIPAAEAEGGDAA